MLVAAIGYTASLMKPIYAGQAPIVGDVIRSVSAETAPPALPLPTGPLADSVARIEASPEFAEQKRRFSADLVRTGRMSQARADSIAHFAVREAFLRGVPPAVIFGVMLTENAKFISHAESNVGAVGLMQVYPKYWFKELSKKFSDPNIAADSTNLRYGVSFSSILSRAARGSGTRDRNGAGSCEGLRATTGAGADHNAPLPHVSEQSEVRERDAQALSGIRISPCSRKRS